jgi:hypothetical protein
MITTATREELCRLAGRSRPSAVARWLDQQGIPYLPGADGWPRVAVSVIMARLGGAMAASSREPELVLE